MELEDCHSDGSLHICKHGHEGEVELEDGYCDIHSIVHARHQHGHIQGDGYVEVHDHGVAQLPTTEHLYVHCDSMEDDRQRMSPCKRKLTSITTSSSFGRKNDS